MKDALAALTQSQKLWGLLCMHSRQKHCTHLVLVRLMGEIVLRGQNSKVGAAIIEGVPEWRVHAVVMIVKAIWRAIWHLEALADSHTALATRVIACAHASSQG